MKRSFLLKDQLQGLIDQLGVRSTVELLGWKSHDDVRRFMRHPDILLVASVTSEDGDQEGIPVALMEALAEGLPVLSTQHSGISELVQDGRAGFLVPERDIDALAEKLEYLIRNRQIWAEMGKVGRDCVEKYYDINKANDRPRRVISTIALYLFRDRYDGIASLSSSTHNYRNLINFGPISGLQSFARISAI